MTLKKNLANIQQKFNFNDNNDDSDYSSAPIKVVDNSTNAFRNADDDDDCDDKHQHQQR